MNAVEFIKKNFILSSLLLCVTYFVVETFYINYVGYGPDDFWFAHWTYRYKNGIPYRDFSPYKTVLGYYILLLPMLFSKALLKPLIYTKIFVAGINAASFFLAAVWLRRFFSSIAIICVLALLMFSEYVLTYSIDFRVDLLAYWFCFFSVMSLLEKRFVLGGLLLGLGFITSQKVIWYLAASNVALGLTWLCFYRDKKTFLNIIFFNLAVLSVIAAYIIFWSSLSSLGSVLHNIFYDSYLIYKADWYNGARHLFWTITITCNPLWFLLFPFWWCSLIFPSKKDASYVCRFFCIVYATVLMCCLIPYKQVFPYYMVSTIPAFLLAYVATFSWLWGLFQEQTAVSRLRRWILNLFVFGYVCGLIYAIKFFTLPICYALIVLLPIFIVLYVNSSNSMVDKNELIFSRLVFLIIFFIGFLYPCVLFSTAILPARNGEYQKSMLALTSNLLKDGSDYVAGVEFFYDKSQPIPGMRQLDSPSVGYLNNPSKNLLPLLSMSSLYHTPMTSQQVIQSLQESNVKCYINNYRIEGLPATIKNYLATQYEHYWGSVYLYAPTISGVQKEFIKFDGDYLIEGKSPVVIGNKTEQPATMVHLKRGVYEFSSSQSFRLKLIPANLQNLLKADFQVDEWERMLR